MALSKIQFSPGIKREGTALTARGGWYDGNLMRFRKGFAEKIGGWVKDTSNTFLSTARALHSRRPSNLAIIESEFGYQMVRKIAGLRPTSTFTLEVDRPRALRPLRGKNRPSEGVF